MKKNNINFPFNYLNCQNDLLKVRLIMITSVKFNNMSPSYRLTDTYLRYKRISHRLRIFREKITDALGTRSHGCGSNIASNWSESAQSPPKIN